MTAEIIEDERADSGALVRKLWQYCNVLRDDGLSYPDYVEQLTYLLFLKLADERNDATVPFEYSWQSLAGLSAAAMHEHYSRVLLELGRRDGMLGVIFRNAKNKIRDPRKLRLLITDLIGAMEWSGLSTDLKGDAYEGLLEKNARDTKSGAGQYFTPRPVVDTIVECVRPKPGEIVCDPACGTGGFLLAAHAYIRMHHQRLTAAQKSHLSRKALRGVELVDEVARLATMNLFLHGIGGNSTDDLPITCADSLQAPTRKKVDVVLTNPPFGVKGSVTYSNAQRSVPADEDLTIHRPDFWVVTANKQLNFVQHVVSLLKSGGRAAVVVPDNVLFEGGAAAVIRRNLIETCRVHTLLRLPTGLFYAQGVKSNVLFFDRDTRLSTGRDRLWVYDLRSENRFSLKTNPLRRTDLDEFVRLYHTRDEASEEVTERWRAFDIQAILNDPEAKLDIAWSKDVPMPRGSSLSRLDDLSRLIAADLEYALEQIAAAAGRRPPD